MTTIRTEAQTTNSVYYKIYNNENFDILLYKVRISDHAANWIRVMYDDVPVYGFNVEITSEKDALQIASEMYELEVKRVSNKFQNEGHNGAKLVSKDERYFNFKREEMTCEIHLDAMNDSKFLHNTEKRSIYTKARQAMVNGQELPFGITVKSEYQRNKVTQFIFIYTYTPGFRISISDAIKHH